MALRPTVGFYEWGANRGRERQVPRRSAARRFDTRRATSMPILNHRGSRRMASERDVSAIRPIQRSAKPYFSASRCRISS